MFRRRIALCALVFCTTLFLGSLAIAQDPATSPGTPPETAAAPAGPTAADLKIMADTSWVMITAFLVFFMNLGFACVESGILPGEELRQHPLEELHRVRRHVDRLLALGLGHHVRQRRHGRHGKVRR